ncbi:MAG: 16S rRNA (cytosine(1402)-N(4))-methyltransferase RsmH [Sedimentisphaerales bacterium]|nr:16S rRNA (cytosine(1402)-N(4))-methyltransferase RsmH [Sedimentisphaerales bacterium]
MKPKTKKSNRQDRRRPFRAKSKTPAGTHIPVLAEEVMATLNPRLGQIILDCTVGFGGHAQAFLEQIGPEGRLIGLDMDAGELERTRFRFKKCDNVHLYHANFAEMQNVLRKEGVEKVDVIFADLGVSSMQIDDASRGIGYKADGPLDMRMNQTLDRTGADLLAELSEAELSRALWELSDEPDHVTIARFIVGQRQAQPITTVDQLIRLVFNAKGLTPRTWKQLQKQSNFGALHPAARTFQALRILVNDELGSLSRLLETAPNVINAGGRIGIISFHSGEDRLVKNAFRQGRKDGVYSKTSMQVIAPRTSEIVRNPRSASAKFRWAQKA